MAEIELKEFSLCAGNNLHLARVVLALNSNGYSLKIKKSSSSYVEMSQILNETERLTMVMAFNEHFKTVILYSLNHVYKFSLLHA